MSLLLAKSPTMPLRSVELYAGAGGLGLGLARAGFNHEIVAERDTEACDTLRLNQRLGHQHVRHWPIHEVDVRSLDLSAIAPNLDLLSGGPPCQPFSIGGKGLGAHDERDMWPWTVKAVRTLAPRSFAFENVRNLVSSHADYLRYIELQLAFPEMGRGSDESIAQHCERLTRYFQHGRPDGLWYRVCHALIDAADLGAPQHRDRVIIVGLRSDLDASWQAPAATHSADELFHDKWISGAYWKRHDLARPEPVGRDLLRLRKANSEPLMLDMFARKAAHRTLRDALEGLPEPTEQEADGFSGHVRPPREARAYKGHTGSPLDQPAKALRAGVHGVSGGENMIDFGQDRYRHFTVREAARLQTFEDGFHFAGSWSTGLKVLGNAVPVVMSEEIGTSLHRILAATLH